MSDAATPTGSQERLLVRIYGDSLSMPRSRAEIDYSSTYAELLCASLAELLPGTRVHLYNRSLGGASITELKQLWYGDSLYFGPRRQGILVIQAGIVDCAPRPLGKNARRLVGQLPARAQARVVRFIHDNRARILRTGLGTRVTGPRRFERTYRAWIEAAARECDRLYAINIAPTTPPIEAHSPGFSASIVPYNDIIRRCVEAAASPNVMLVDAYEAILRLPDGVDVNIDPSDGHHITLRGHELYRDMILHRERAYRGLADVERNEERKHGNTKAL